jgi:exodeoxyribonuclease VII large subunit
MTDAVPSDPAEPLGHNIPVLSVSELSQQVKRTVEGSFGRVRVRGEISGFKRAASGHLYLALKDADAVLDGVCWRGTAQRLSIVPEDGLEVVATGRLTTYPGRSKYQIVIESLELAGEGALLKLLEERKRRLAEEGLFDEARKRPLPHLPEVIGVVTSPTGAVIRDILHRLAERFPRRVLLWPVLVQGEGAADQVAAAIEGFNALRPGGPVPRPDVLIVARGGGSLEDLWAFNEEVVVRAAAASEIPLIAAVGHETDWTLIDLAADRRAPTPTAAAEMAVPVRADLAGQVLDLERRMAAAGARMVSDRRERVEGLACGLPDARRLVEDHMQRLDDTFERLAQAARGLLRDRAGRIAQLAAGLIHPRRQLGQARERLDDLAGRLDGLRRQALKPQRQAFDAVDAARRLERAVKGRLDEAETILRGLERVLESMNYKAVLQRGYAVVRRGEEVLTRAAQVAGGAALEIEFHDGRVAAVAAGSARREPPPRPERDPDGKQGTLL